MNSADQILNIKCESNNYSQNSQGPLTCSLGIATIHFNSNIVNEYVSKLSQITNCFFVAVDPRSLETKSLIERVSLIQNILDSVIMGQFLKRSFRKESNQ